MTGKRERLGVSLASDLVAFVRDEAERRGVSLSQVVAEALRLRKVETLRAAIMDGLLADAEAQQRMARGDFR